MTDPAWTVEEYLERIAMSTVELVSADDRDARGVVVTVESGTARCERAFLREFLFRMTEDAVDSEVGGTGHGSFCPPAYSGRLHRQPDQVAYLIEPVPGLVPRPVGVEVEWHALALPVPDGIDAETWAEYGFARAIETVVVRQAAETPAFGCLVPFHADVLEAGVYVMSGFRGRGIGRVVAGALFDRLDQLGRWCHWVTLAGNDASQRLGRLARVQVEARIGTYTWP